MRRVVSIVAAALLASTLPGVATADDHRPPKAVLRLDQHTQPGRISHFTWLRATPDPDECIADFADGFGWLRALRYKGEPRQAVIRLHKAAPPLEVRFEAWLETDPQGNPAGPAVPIPYALQPRPSPLAPERWDISFTPPPTAHLFLELEASWRDEDGCTDATDFGEQFVVWRFKLRQTAGSCTRARAAKVVRAFIRAYNRGNLDRLERLWAQEPDFQWYFVDDEREADAENRASLGTYFAARHGLNDHIRLRRLRVAPRGDDGSFGFGFELFRKTDDERRKAEGLFHGKGSVTQATASPSVADPNPVSRCLLHVWAMDNDEA